jgi:hypothetical protein
MRKNGLAVLALALFACFVQADDYLSPTNERVRLSLGAMHLSSTTSLRVDSSQGAIGTPVSAEDDFGLESSDFEPKFQAMIRVGERHRLRFDYFTLDRTGQTTVGATPIRFRDVVLRPTDPLTSNLSLRALGISYGYSFIHREKFEIAATFGVNDVDISSQERVAPLMRRVDQSEAGPFPTLGLDATYVLSKRFYVDARAQYMKVSVNHLSGSFGVYEIDALYRLRPNISFAVGYTALKANLLSRQAKDGGYFDFDSKGPQVFVRIAF